MKASVLSFRVAVLFGIAGIALGIGMAMSHDHLLRPVHAHVNLVGWVSLFLFGIYYKFHPALDVTRIAQWQVISWAAGTMVLSAAVAAIYLGYTAAEPVAGVSSIILLGSMFMFAYLVFRPAIAGSDEPHARLTPAE